MTTIKEIEKAISNLPEEKVSILRSWFEKFDSMRWEKRIRKDFKDGKFNTITAKVRDNYKKGKSKEL